MISIGIDTAQKNCGLVVAKDTEGGRCEILHAVNFQPRTSYPDSDFIVNAQVIYALRKLVRKFKPDFAALESAALAAKFGMVSIGSIHGAILQALVDERLPFVYVTPGKLKYAMFGKGNATKERVRRTACEASDLSEFLGLSKTKVDFNIADAAALALVGLSFAEVITYRSKLSKYKSGLNPDFLNFIFFQSHPVNKRTKKKPGIIFRENEFFWIPIEIRDEVLNG